jgi:hypothetical protein
LQRGGGDRRGFVAGVFNGSRSARRKYDSQDREKDKKMAFHI